MIAGAAIEEECFLRCPRRPSLGAVIGLGVVVGGSVQFSRLPGVFPGLNEWNYGWRSTLAGDSFGPRPNIDRLKKDT